MESSYEKCFFENVMKNSVVIDKKIQNQGYI